MRRRTANTVGSLAAVVVAALGVAVLAPGIAGAGPHTTPQAPATGTASSAAAPLSTVSAAAASDALQDLRALPVSDAYVPGYNRAAFGPAWADVDHNSCDTRNDVLRRDLVDVVTKPGTYGCVVLSGTLHDPYTGRTIAFHRGETSSMAVQIDHRWPLGLVWGHGAASWTPAQREAFANDPAELVAVDGQANEEKSDSGPGEWMPPNADDACAYTASFVTVATKWRLSIASKDEHALERTLTGCSTQGSN